MEETKRCSGCDRSLPFCDFNWRNKQQGKLQHHCKTCQRACQNRYYRRTPEYQADVKAASKRRKIDIKIQYLNYLKQNKCCECGVSNPIVLTFDHRDPSQKTECVSVMVQLARSWENIQKEIDKCDIVCFNCHAIRTAKLQKWYENWKHIPADDPI